MKDHMQTIINVCFAISITAFIYQNNIQQDRINTLEAQTNSKSLKDIDALMYDLSILEVEVETHKDRFVTLINNWEQQDTYNNDQEYLLSKITRSIDKHQAELDEINWSISGLPKPKTNADFEDAVREIVKESINEVNEDLNDTFYKIPDNIKNMINTQCSVTGRDIFCPLLDRRNLLN